MDIAFTAAEALVKKSFDDDDNKKNLISKTNDFNWNSFNH